MTRLAAYSMHEIVRPPVAAEEVRSLNGSSLACDEFMLPSGDPGIDIYVRNKYLPTAPGPHPRRTILCMHGSTYPGHVVYDVRLDGLSWMDYMALKGNDVYVLDIRGYGRSTRPPEMEKPPEENDAIVDNAVALRDISTVVDFIFRRRGISRINLIGWSWGTTLMATYAIRNPHRVERLVLVGPQWIRTTPPLTKTYVGRIPAYRIAKRDRALERWLTGVPQHRRGTLIPEGWADSVLDAVWSSDPIGAEADPPYIRAPNGTLQDSREYWLSGRPYYDPGEICAPTLIVLAEWDAETPPYMAQTLFPLLANAPDKRYVCFGEGTHLMPLERRRFKVFDTVQQFFEGM
jgi:pimeloyl-ACP methyl ester carboxylesterase